MLTAAVVLFGLGALGGIYLASSHLKGAPPPVAIALIHGALGAAGLIALFLAWRAPGGGALGLALILFVVAALGGFVLFARHMRGQPLPRGLIAVHALVAVTAFVILLTHVF